MEEALALARQALARRRCGGTGALPTSSLSACLDEAYALAAEVAAAQLELIFQLDDRGEAIAQGASSTAAWLAGRQRISHAAATQTVKLAVALHGGFPDDAGAKGLGPTIGLAATAEALATGRINLEQVRVIAKSLDLLPTDLRAEGEWHLLDEAEIYGPHELARVGRRLFKVLAPDEAKRHALAEFERRERRAHAQRGLHLTDLAGGSRVKLSGWLDREGAAQLRAALDPLCAPHAKHPADTPPPAGSPADSTRAGSADSTPCAEPLADTPPAERSNGNTPPAERSNGKGPHTERSNGKAPHAERSNGKAPHAERSNGRAPHAERSNGKGPHTERSNGKAPHAERSNGKAPHAGSKGTPSGRLGHAGDVGGRSGDQPHAEDSAYADEVPGHDYLPHDYLPHEARDNHLSDQFDDEFDRMADDERRTPGQRRADALVDICRLALAYGNLPDNGGERPHVVVTMDFDTLRTGLGLATLDDGSNLSAEAARRIACDANVVPAVLGGTGQILDLGRARRLFTGPIRRALIIRDGGCAFPHCDRPPQWTDGHHIVHWAAGGLTNLTNAVLLCRFHHRLIHHSEWTVEINLGDGLPDFIPPAAGPSAPTPAKHVPPHPITQPDAASPPPSAPRQLDLLAHRASGSSGLLSPQAFYLLSLNPRI